MAARRPLPGIRFEGRTPPLRDPLPRMDIPVFVGFAASGPIDVPVPIEDPAEFGMIFGRDVPLPRRRGAAEELPGHLAAAVRAFFANGGRRCWIVRVAGRGAAVNRFPLPGVKRVSSAGALEPAEIVARSEGSWSDALRVTTNLVSRPLAFLGFDPDLGGATVDVAVGSRGEIAAGDLLRVTWQGVDASLHLFVQAVTAPLSSPAGAATGTTRVSGRSLWLSGDAVTPAPNPATLTGHAMAERLAFDLTVSDERGAPIRLSELGFAPDHPRYLGALPPDAVLFDEAVEAVDGRALSFRPRQRATFGSNFLNQARAPEAGWAGLWRDASLRRFPLASDEADGAAYLPAGMGVLPSDPPGVAIAATGTTLDRDGLASFDASLFLDADLDDATLRDLLDRADTIRYRASPSRRLTGVHAVLGVDEATMVAVPDLVHAGWERAGDTPLASPLASSPLDHPEWWRWLDCRGPRPEPAPAAFSGFVDCVVTMPIAPPWLEVADIAGGSYDLRWDAHDGTLVELQESLRPDFGDAVTIARDPDGAVRLYNRPPGDYYYRARRLAGSRTSDWSTGVAVRVPRLSSWIALESYDPATLINVQRALVRLCAARADRVALLSLPGHYDAAMAVAHVTALTAPPMEPAALSYGALWHPWVVRRDSGSGALQAAPPEGMMAAVMAGRAIARGAWVAPANEALRGVVALVPAIPPAAHQPLQDAAINLLRQEPAGFLCLNADTLSLEEDLRPLNVRRLLILVRKAALRAGNRFTFEPNGERLRRAMKRGFETLLEEMFARGAFAGSRSRDAFQVATGEPPNTRQDADAGRFLAEIRVAPSRPLSFLTVRLVRRGESAVAVEVR